MTDLEAKRLETQAMLDSTNSLFGQEQCRAALQRVADDIIRGLADEHPLLLPVAGGVIVFTGQLLPLLRFPLDFDYVHVSRYDDKLAGGVFNQERIPDPEQVKGRRVVVLDDILGEGRTMATIQKKLLEVGAASCHAAVFANKLIDKERPTQADYVGSDVPNRYVFSYGMGAAGCQRNPGEIYTLNNKQDRGRLRSFQTASNQHQEHIITDLLIVTHETIGGAYQGLTHHFFPSGFPGDACILGAQPNEDRNDIINSAIAALQEFPDNRGVLVMTNIFGATPYNVTRRLVHEDKSAVLTGLNAPMMVKAIQYSSQTEDLSDSTETIGEAIIRNILAITSAPEGLVCKENG